MCAAGVQNKPMNDAQTLKRQPPLASGLLIAAAALAAGIALASCSAAEPQASPTDLEIVVRNDGATVSGEYRLRCQGEQVGAGSTLPTAEAACALLASNPAVLSPAANQNRICTEIYGGPDTAQITGTLAGRSVSVSFDRHNGCAIDDWAAAAPLLGDGALNSN